MRRAVVRGAALAGGMALWLAACQASPSDWTKPGASDADLKRDLQDCRAQAAALSPMVYDQRTQLVQTDELDVLQLAHNYGVFETVLNKSLATDLETAEIVLKLIKASYLRVE